MGQGPPRTIKSRDDQGPSILRARRTMFLPQVDNHHTNLLLSLYLLTCYPTIPSVTTTTMSPPAVMLLDNELRNCEIFEKLISGAGAYASQQAQIASSSTTNNTNTSSSNNNGNNQVTREQPSSAVNNDHHRTNGGQSVIQNNPPAAAAAVAAHPAPSSFPPPPSVEVFSVGGDILHWLYVYQMSFSFVDTLGGLGVNATLHFALRMPTRARPLVTGPNNDILRAISRASAAVLTVVHTPSHYTIH